MSCLFFPGAILLLAQVPWQCVHALVRSVFCDFPALIGSSLTFWWRWRVWMACCLPCPSYSQDEDASPKSVPSFLNCAPFPWERHFTSTFFHALILFKHLSCLRRYFCFSSPPIRDLEIFWSDHRLVDAFPSILALSIHHLFSVGANSPLPPIAVHKFQADFCREV